MVGGDGTPAGDCPTGTGGLLATWAALRGSGFLGWGKGIVTQHQGQRQIGRWTRQQAEPSNTSVGSARKTNLSQRAGQLRPRE